MRISVIGAIVAAFFVVVLVVLVVVLGMNDGSDCTSNLIIIGGHPYTVPSCQ